MQEIWKSVKEYNGYLEVSSLGRIRTFAKRAGNDKLICAYRRTQDNGHGYETVMLSYKGKKSRVYVHRLVAMQFVENPFCLEQVNHKDGNKKNNKAENLEWVTPSQNIIHSRDVLNNYKKQIEKQNKRVLCIELNIEFPSIKSAAEYFGDYRNKGGGIGYAAHKGHKAKGYHWKILE